MERYQNASLRHTIGDFCQARGTITDGFWIGTKCGLACLMHIQEVDPWSESYIYWESIPYCSFEPNTKVLNIARLAEDRITED